MARLLREIGQRIELSGDSPFKSRAYERAAESLLALTEPLDEVVAAGRLRDIPGVGEAIAEKILALHESGTHRTLERLRQEVPDGALDMLAIPGLTAKNVRQIESELKIDSVEGLEAACRAGALSGVKGLGPALQRKILQGIRLMRQARGQRLIHHAEELLRSAAANLGRSHPELERIAIAGDFRRGCELVHDLNLVAQTREQLGSVQSTPINNEVDLSVADHDRYGVALLLATGSAEHVEQLRALADGTGFSLDEGGLRRGKKLIRCPEEEEVYAALGLPFIAPELRETGDEANLAAENRLPELVSAADIRGILHSHTDRSDGVNTLEEMAAATRERGYSYYGVADHSKSAGYAGGLSVEEIEAQHEDIERLNRTYKGRFRILKGIESDILVDGSLDYLDEVLARFDFVVASVHSRFQLDEATQTERILRAIAHPHTTILGHMTGRMLLRREGYEVDVERILTTCAEHGVAVEINGNPHRLDLDWRWHRRALELGCMLSINPDAHSIAELDLVRWGVLMARKGGVPKQCVLNCLGRDAIT
ncbi:MAG TPA: PHP domain-containing protein, partial [Propylenella sp.]|nr:PHP domain-containing protein [Propylenella sp.]